MSSVFYSKGLRFSCIGCGRCCTIPDGVVFLEGEDIRNLAQYLGISEEEFLQKYTHTEGKFVVLNDFPNGECIFYRRGEGCAVYPARPRQCRTFPFWDSILSSPERWDEMAKQCPGINRGKLYSCEEIEAIRRGEKDT